MRKSVSVSRKHVRSRSKPTAVATVLALVTSTLIGGLILPITPPAAAAEVVVDLGESTAVQHDVATNSFTTPASAYRNECVRYSPDGTNVAAGDYTTAVVSSTDNQFASFGYSYGQGMRCPGEYNDQIQSTVGLKPAATDSVTAGSPFLVATMRHSNRPVLQLGNETPTVVNGTMDLTLGSAISSSFPWTLTETSNTCRSTFDADGNYAPGGTYAFDANGNIGTRATWTAGGWSSNYHYAYNRNGNLTSFPYGDTAVAGDSGGAIYGADGRSCEDDILEVSSATESTAWTDTTTGIQYKLKLWGFVNNGTDGVCSTDLAADDNLEDTFITKENAETYGCLYGSLEQVRSVTFAKDVTTDPSLEDSTEIPTFEYENVSEEGSTALADWDSISPLTPTDWGEAGTATDPEHYELLAPDDQAIVKELNANTATETTSGWRLTGVDCVTDGDGQPLLNSDGEVLTDSAVNLSEGTLNLSSSELAETAENTAITCTWHNEYVGRSQLTLVKEIEGPTFPAVSTDNWTLTATPTQTSEEGADYPYRTISGLSGEESVTGQWTRTGTYTLSEEANGDVVGFSQQGDWSCVDQDGAAVTVTDSQVTLGVDQQVTCTVTNAFKTGSIQINKTVSDPDGGLNNPDKTYTGTYDCGSANGRDFSGTWSATTSTPAVITDLPVGTECTITEDTPSGDLKDASYEWIAPSIDNPTIQVPTAPAAAQVNVTNTIVRDTGNIIINKVVEAADEASEGGWTGGEDRTFEVEYTCGDVSGTVEVSTGTPAQLILPVGATCSFSEVAPDVEDGDFQDASYEWTGAGSFDSSSVTVGESNPSITVTNTYKQALVDLNLAKRVDGDGYNGADAAFTINYDCGTGYAGSVDVANGSTATVQVPRGAQCTVSEPDASLDETLLADAYDWGTPSYEGLDAADGTKVDAADGGKTVTVVNPTVAGWGKVSVTKSVSPDASPVTAGTTFPVTVTCDKPAQGQTENYSGTFDLAASGSNATATTPYLAAGASCTVSEAAPTGSDGLTDASYSWQAGPADQTVTVQGDQTQPVTVTNTWQRAYGDFTVTKQLTDVDSQGADNTYTGTWTCTHPGDEDATGTWSVTGSGKAALTVSSGPATSNGDSAAVLLGSTCTVTENDPGAPSGEDSSYVFSTAGTTSGPVTISSEAGTGNVNVTNVVTRTTGGLTITKSVEGAEAGTGFADTNFTFTYTCTPLTGEAITGTATVSAGKTTDPITGIPAGSECTVTEDTSNLPAPIDPYRWDEGGTSMTATPSSGAATSADGASISFTMPDGEDAGVAVAATNTMSERYGSIQVTKTVAEANKVNGFTGTGKQLFPVVVTCDGAQVYSGSLADGETVTVGDIPLGQTCTVTEGTIDGGLADGSYAWGEPTITDPVTVTGEDASVTVTNTIERVRADVNLTKVLSGDLATQLGTDNTYSGSFTCTHTGDADVTGTWSVDGAGNASVTYDNGEAPFVDSTCTPTEELDASGAPDADPVFSWGEPSYDPATVTADGTATMTVTNTVDRAETAEFSVRKDAVDVTRDQDGYTATYTVTVENTSNIDGQIIADATDTPALPGTAKITGVAVLEDGETVSDADIPGITDGVLDGPITLAKAGTGPVLAAGDTRVFTVQISFTVDVSAADFDEADYQCGHERADGAASGLVNTVAMEGDTDGEGNNTACQSLPPSTSTPTAGPTPTASLTPTTPGHTPAAPATPSHGGSHLALTGANGALFLTVAGCLLVAGAILLAVQRRRRGNDKS